MASVTFGHYKGSVYDASTSDECYAVNGFVVANCRRALNPRPDIDRHIDRPIDSPADLPFPGSVQSPEAREDQKRFEEALRRQGEQRRQRRRRASRASRGGSRARRPPRARREAARGQPAARGPALGGYSAAERDERGRRVARPDWGEKLGAVETPVEVLSGPSDRQIAMAGHTPGRGVAYATSDGRLFYVEYPPDIGITDKLRFDSAVGARLKTLLEEDRRALPRGMRGYPVIMSVQAPAVSELKLIQLSGNDVRVYADAGEGRIIHYHGEVHPQGVWHETGHSVMSRLNDLMGGEGGLPQTPPSSWVQAAERDRANLIRRPAFDAFNGNPSPTAAAHEVLELGGNRKLGQDFPGVTGYGATKSTEDWAEAWRLAILNDQQGYIALDGDREIRFEEMFPTRAQWLIDVQNEFDVEFPFSFDEDLIDEVLFSGFE